MVEELRETLGVEERIQLTVTDKTNNLAKVRYGHITLHSSFLNRSIEEQEFILAHEIAHIKIGHKKIIPVALAQVIFLISLLVAAILPPCTLAFAVAFFILVVLATFETAGFVALGLPALFREEEREADKLAFFACSRETQEVVPFIRFLFHSDEGGIFSSHPSSSERRRHLKQYLAQIHNDT